MKNISEQLGSIELFFTHGKQCHRTDVGADGLSETNDVPELQNDHEEGDTCMLLHAKHASHDHVGVVIRSLDMDIFVLVVGYNYSFHASLYFVTGTGNNCRIIDIIKIQEELLSDLFLGTHWLPSVYRYHTDSLYV